VLRAAMFEAAKTQQSVMVGRLLRRVGETAESIGNTIDARGTPFSQEHFFAMLDKVWIDFDEYGRPDLSSFTLVLHPDNANVFTSICAWEHDRAFVARLEDVMQKKRAEWHDRESNRKLVD
jgi:hypothetical protein